MLFTGKPLTQQCYDVNPTDLVCLNPARIPESECRAQRSIALFRLGTCYCNHGHKSSVSRKTSSKSPTTLSMTSKTYCRTPKTFSRSSKTLFRSSATFKTKQKKIIGCIPWWIVFMYCLSFVSLCCFEHARPRYVRKNSIYNNHWPVLHDIYSSRAQCYIRQPLKPFLYVSFLFLDGYLTVVLLS